LATAAAVPGYGFEQPAIKACDLFDGISPRFSIGSDEIDIENGQPVTGKAF